MSTVVQISAAIEKLHVKEQVELLRILPQHLKISLDDLTWSKLAEPAFEFWDNLENAIYDHFLTGGYYHPHIKQVSSWGKGAIPMTFRNRPSEGGIVELDR
jgi:hypothetical protein